MNYEKTDKHSGASWKLRFRTETDFLWPFEGVITLMLRNFIWYSDSTHQVTLTRGRSNDFSFFPGSKNALESARRPRNCHARTPEFDSRCRPKLFATFAEVCTCCARRWNDILITLHLEKCITKKSKKFWSAPGVELGCLLMPVYRPPHTFESDLRPREKAEIVRSPSRKGNFVHRIRISNKISEH